MKNTLLVVTLLFALPTCAQQVEKKVDLEETADEKPKPIERKTAVTNQETEISDTNDYGWSKRVSFIVGGGPSIVATKLYTDPGIRKDNNNVVIDEASRLKPNLTLGIVFTPYVVSNIRDVSVIRDGVRKYVKVIDYYPKGITYALFVNPVSISKINENFYTSTVDLGGGIGYRSGSFSFLVTTEIFNVRQPRKQFIEDYMGKNKPYIVNGEIQNWIDIGDTGIFTSKTGISFGVKIAYTFDVIKSFSSTSTASTATDKKEDTKK